MKKAFLVSLLIVLCASGIHGQRLLPGMKGIQFTASAVDKFRLKDGDGQAYAGSIKLSTYTRKGNQWVFGGEYLQKKYAYDENLIPTAQFTGEGGYYLNFLSDHSKTINFSVGFSALVGYETINWGKKTLPDGALLQNGDKFLYGGALAFEIDTYLSDKFILSLHVRERFLPSSSVSDFHFQYGFGLKIIIN